MPSDRAMKAAGEIYARSAEATLGVAGFGQRQAAEIIDRHFAEPTKEAQPITPRQLYAAAAMNAIIRNTGDNIEEVDGLTQDQCLAGTRNAAFQWADAMLAAERMSKAKETA
jgi:hypothetical protein